MLDLAIIGAGPYGLSLAAHAQKARLNYKVFGYPMDFWHKKMPPHMFIRTQLAYTGLSDPDNEYTLRKYESEKNANLSYPLPRSVFVDYGFWFIEKTKISIEEVLVTNVIDNNGYFTIQTEIGESFKAKRVIVAVGLTNSKYIPPILRGFSNNLVSHTADYTEYRTFRNQHVMVLGGGQSAWEAAALLHQANAKVDLVYRRPQRLSPSENLNAKQQELAAVFYHLPRKEQEAARQLFEKPTVSDFLVPLVEGKATERPNSYIHHVEQTKDNKIQVTFNDHSSAVFDHVIAATGYRFTPSKLSFLHALIEKIDLNEAGQPIVNENFESTCSNLFFVGPAAAYSHGPTYRFIAGVWRTSEVLVNYMERNVKNNV